MWFGRMPCSRFPWHFPWIHQNIIWNDKKIKYLSISRFFSCWVICWNREFIPNSVFISYRISPNIPRILLLFISYCPFFWDFFRYSFYIQYLSILCQLLAFLCKNKFSILTHFPVIDIAFSHASSVDMMYDRNGKMYTIKTHTQYDQCSILGPALTISFQLKATQKPNNSKWTIVV